MKKLAIYFSFVLLSGVLFFTSCEMDEPMPVQEESILPDELTIEIPSALFEDQSGLKTAYRVDTMKGQDVYRHLRLFIHVGNHGARMVRHIMRSIRVYDIDRIITLTYESEDDGRIKNLVVIEGPEFDGRTWEYGLTITDAESEGNEDGGIGMQVFWNRRPKEGVTLIRPSNLDFTNEREMAQAIFRIDYSGAGEMGYDRHMIISIADLPMKDPLLEPFAMNAMKMFVGKKGDFVDVYGNSSHPNAKLLTATTGYNWAFVASGSERKDIAAAEVGLPLSTLDAEGRAVLLEAYSIKNVFTNEVKTVWPNASDEILEAWLYNTEAPGFFDHKGFIQGGTLPGPEYTDVANRLLGLSPYNPKSIANLEITFN